MCVLKILCADWVHTLRCESALRRLLCVLRAGELLSLAQGLFRADCAVLTLLMQNSSVVLACVGHPDWCGSASQSGTQCVVCKARS